MCGKLNLYLKCSMHWIFHTHELELTGAPKFDKHFLRTHGHPLVQAVAQAREYNKARTTFIDTILKHEHKGRIHAEINQLRGDGGGTVTGRLSYNTPNLQQVPSSKVLGPMIRSLFKPEEGMQWGAFRLLTTRTTSRGSPR